MYQTISKWRVSAPIITGLLAVMMMLGSAGTANAQDAGIRIMLPLVQAGSSAAQPVDGPFLDMAELPASSIVAEVDPNATLTLEESTAEVSAAGSCYGGAGTIPTRSVGAYKLTGWSPMFYASNRCRDVNMWLNAPAGMYAQIKFYPTWGSPYTTNFRPTGLHYWRVIAWNLIDGTRFQVRLYNPAGYAQTYSGKLAY